MLRTIFAVLAAYAGLIGSAGAGEITDPRSFAIGQWGLGTAVRVYATYESRGGCARFTDRHLGAPGRLTDTGGVVTGVIEVTFTVDDPRGRCGGPRLIQDLIVVSNEVTNYMVRIFFVSPDGRVLKIENTSIRG